MVDYDKLYSDNRAVFGGGKPSPIARQAAELLNGGEGKRALDLGAGQGRDAFYLANLGFMVDAVDKSETAIQQIQQAKDWAGKITATAADLNDYKIDKKYDLILSVNVLHFLPRERILVLIDEIKQAVKNDGVVAITLLLDNGHLKTGELKKLFEVSNFEIVDYEENMRHDPGHPGQPEPHEHRLAGIVAMKRN